MSSNYEVIKCPICGDSRYKELETGYKCKTCDSVFFKVSEEETYKLHEAKTELEIYNFTKADRIYNNILKETKDEKTKVMCYFGRLLAYFGVVYVKDFNGNLVITISNYDPEYTSIKETTYYKLIKESIYYNLYSEQLEKLDKEYQRIKIELNKGNKYDVFICTKISLKTKENPDLEGRTLDSHTALQIYDELTRKGLNVFYSDKVLSGIDYDAQIFSALIRSKNIIVITSKKEYLESAWVESEWQRWINFIKKDVKENNSLYLYIPNGKHFELPNLLQKTQKFSDTLELVNRIDDIYHPVKQEIKKIDIEEELEKAENDLLFGEIESAEKIYKTIINEYPKEYRPWLGLVKVLEEEEVSSEDRRYKNFLNRALSLCIDKQEKDRIEKEYRKYLQEEVKPIVVENKKPIVEEVKKEVMKETIVTPIVNTPVQQKVVEESNDYKITLENSGKDKLTVIKVIREITGLGLKEAKDLADNTPKLIKENISSDEANKIKSILEEVGAKVKVESKKVTVSNPKIVENKKPFVEEVKKEEHKLLKLKLNEDKKSYTIIGIKDLKINELSIPREYDGIPITQIKGFVFRDCNNLTKVEIPNSVIKIDEYAFSACKNLEEVIFEKDIKLFTLEPYTFYDCEKLKKIELPKSIVKIGTNNFEKCISLRDIYYDGTLENWCSVHLEDSPMIYVSNIYMKDNNGEYYLVTDIKIPNTITELGTKQFKGFKNTTEVFIPSSVINIGTDVFEGCYKLSNIKVDEKNKSYKSIDGNLYDKGINKLIQYSRGKKDKSFVVPSTVSSIESNAFSYSSLTNVELSENLKKIGDYAFNECANLTDVEIPRSVTSIGKYSFYKCLSLKTITLSDSIVNIGIHAFQNFKRLDKNMQIYCELKERPNGWDRNWATDIGSIIWNYRILYELSKDGISYIVKGVGNNYVENIKIPSTYKELPVTSIADSAFSGCKKLVDLEIPKTIKSIGNYAFNSCESLTNIYYDGTMADWCNISLISTPMAYAQNIYMKDAQNEYKEVTEIIIPDNVTSIGDYQFYGFDNVTKITLPKNIKNIGEEALSCDKLSEVYYRGTVEDWCNISFNDYDSTPMDYAEHIYMLDKNNKYYEAIELVIPDSITSIGNYQFYGFTNLTKIVISNNVTRIGEYAFDSCENLSNIEIPTGVKKLNSYTFGYCKKLKNIKIPKTVCEIEEMAFTECLNLTNVCFDGSIEEWWNIKFNGIDSDPMYFADNLYLLKEGKEYYDTNILIIPDSVKILKKEHFEHLNNIDVIYIPKTVEQIEANTFKDCKKTIRICCQTKKPLFKKQPDGWADNWNGNKEHVLWGIKEVSSVIPSLPIESYPPQKIRNKPIVNEAPKVNLVQKDKAVDVGSCSVCGAKLRPGARFCSSCGHIIRNNNNVSAEKSKSTTTTTTPKKEDVSNIEEAKKYRTQGYNYEHGKGVTKDLKKAFECYQKAANLGYAVAQNDLGICYKRGQGVTKDYTKAVYWYEKAANQGNMYGQRNLGLCYKKGEGVTQNYYKAFELFTKAANQGYVDAQIDLGICYENGQGVAKDYTKAVYWYEKAANQGNMYGQKNLGYMYKNGLGVAQNYYKAFELFTKAANQGHTEAYNSLGVCYHNGEGVTRDYQQAKYWYEKAAIHGNMHAKNNLGILYENGLGVVKSIQTAIHWYEQAANQGHTGAKEKLKKLRGY